MGIRTRRDVGLNDSNLEVRAGLGEAEGGAQTAGTGADDDDVGLGVRVEILVVAAGHGARDLRLTDRLEGEVFPLALSDVCVAISSADLAVTDRNAALVGEHDRLDDVYSGGGHIC